jgi:ribosomal protein S12 methylthiotransferase accessory factor
MNAPGPPPTSRKVPEAEFLRRALVAGRSCGVTRLADITGLDRLGLPVWQAVRPAGKALSVHQGKGSSAAAARIGALCEAIESHCAENAPADGPVCRFDALDAGQAAPRLSDYGATRASLRGMDQDVAWSRATDIASGSDALLPHAVLSLDLTRDAPSRFDRSSSGLAVGGCLEEAQATALAELIERDGVGEWERGGRVARLASEVDAKTIPFDWLAEWMARLLSNDIVLQVHAPPPLIPLPVFSCTIAGPTEFGPGPRIFTGSAAHVSAETALFRALAEAIQSRATFIAGVRDDILPQDYRPPPPGTRLAMLLSSFGAPLRPWSSFPDHEPSLATLIESLARAGYPQVLGRQLGETLEGLAVTKMFVPGLGSLHRARRRPQ